MICYILTNYSYCFNVSDFVKNQLLSFVYPHERLDFGRQYNTPQS